MPVAQDHFPIAGRLFSFVTPWPPGTCFRGRSKPSFRRSSGNGTRTTLSLWGPGHGHGKVMLQQAARRGVCTGPGQNWAACFGRLALSSMFTSTAEAQGRPLLHSAHKPDTQYAARQLQQTIRTCQASESLSAPPTGSQLLDFISRLQSLLVFRGGYACFGPSARSSCCLGLWVGGLFPLLWVRTHG